MQSSSPNEEEFVRFLGEGSFGCVNLVRYSNGSSSSYLSAVKTSHQEDCDSLQSELQILLELRGYPNIVTCLGDSLEESYSKLGERLYQLQLEYASEGSLSAFMDRHADRKLPEPLIKDFTRMVLRGLVSVHGHGYVHCDIKPENLLVFLRQDSSSYEVKICDFGNALEVGEVPMYWGSRVPWVGTPFYMSPESVRYGVVYKTLDLWSVGCLVLEMYTGVSPWEGVRLDHLATRLRCGEAPEIPESLPSDAKEFIGTCFSKEHEERGSAYELLSHRFLPRQQVEEEEEDEKKTRRSFLLKLFRRRCSNKKPRTDAVSVSDKEPLTLRFFNTKATRFQRTMNKVLRLKFMPLKKSTGFNLLSVH